MTIAKLGLGWIDMFSKMYTSNFIRYPDMTRTEKYNDLWETARFFL